MSALHLYVGGCAILAGLLAGTVLGLFFHGAEWLGGYLDLDKYNRLTVQASRGCPRHCKFCASSILLSPQYKQVGSTSARGPTGLRCVLVLRGMTRENPSRPCLTRVAGELLSITLKGGSRKPIRAIAASTKKAKISAERWRVGPN